MMRRMKWEDDDSNEIYPSKMYIIVMFDKYGTSDGVVTEKYSGNTAYFDSINDAMEFIKHIKSKNYEFNKERTFKIKAVPFEDYYNAYRKEHGGRRLTKKQREDLLEELNSSDDGRSPYTWLMLTDEIEPRDTEEIFRKASGYRPGHPGSPEDWERGKKAVKEYLEGIDRKKKSTKPKLKRQKKTVLETVLPSAGKIKSLKKKAESKLKNIVPTKINLRKKKTRKVVKRKTGGKK